MQTLITDFFEQDHHRLDQIFAEFQQNKQDTEKAIELFSQFKSGLIQHIQWEEKLLFPSVESAAGFPPNAGPTAVMRMEHIQIKDCLSLIEKQLNQAGDTAAMEAQLTHILSGHNMKEENILYPMSDESIPADTAQHLIAQCQS